MIKGMKDFIGAIIFDDLLHQHKFCCLFCYFLFRNNNLLFLVTTTAACLYLLLSQTACMYNLSAACSNSVVQKKKSILKNLYICLSEKKKRIKNWMMDIFGNCQTPGLHHMGLREARFFFHRPDFFFPAGFYFNFFFLVQKAILLGYAVQVDLVNPEMIPPYDTSGSANNRVYSSIYLSNDCPISMQNSDRSRQRLRVVRISVSFISHSLLTKLRQDDAYHTPRHQVHFSSRVCIMLDPYLIKYIDQVTTCARLRLSQPEETHPSPLGQTHQISALPTTMCAHPMPPRVSRISQFCQEASLKILLTWSTMENQLTQLTNRSSNPVSQLPCAQTQGSVTHERISLGLGYPHPFNSQRSLEDRIVSMIPINACFGSFFFAPVVVRDISGRHSSSTNPNPLLGGTIGNQWNSARQASQDAEEDAILNLNHAHLISLPSSTHGYPVLTKRLPPQLNCHHKASFDLSSDQITKTNQKSLNRIHLQRIRRAEICLGVQTPFWEYGLFSFSHAAREYIIDLPPSSISIRASYHTLNQPRVRAFAFHPSSNWRAANALVQLHPALGHRNDNRKCLERPYNRRKFHSTPKPRRAKDQALEAQSNRSGFDPTSSRRREQNRVHQRAFRQRRKVGLSSSSSSHEAVLILIITYMFSSAHVETKGHGDNESRTKFNLAKLVRLANQSFMCRWLIILHARSRKDLSTIDSHLTRFLTISYWSYGCPGQSISKQATFCITEKEKYQPRSCLFFRCYKSCKSIGLHEKNDWITRSLTNSRTERKISRTCKSIYIQNCRALFLFLTFSLPFSTNHSTKVPNTDTLFSLKPKNDSPNLATS
ncbi:hypothetical protein VP01_2176g2 [Puccinia sorghi]|uniref:Uncharacterized protein n=1 Tax=Puccinia sorghi TaxID=27349 RepID=A0A0L6V9E5_9BASI|nr:hypothetical protein VP01_2176g2 [Puccinia sorghi]